MHGTLAGRPWFGTVLVGFLTATAILLAGCEDQPGAQPPDLPTWMSPVPIRTPVPPPLPAPSVWHPVAEVNVTNFFVCSCEINQAQIKVKVGLKNIGAEPLSIPIQNIRLLTDNFDRALWDPDNPTPNEPSAVTMGDQKFTAIPANANRSFRWVNVDGRQAMTWASHWYANTLNPGQPYHIDGASEGHVVFNIPLTNGDHVNISGIGLVADDGNTLLGWSPVKDWPDDQTDPKNF